MEPWRLIADSSCDLTGKELQDAKIGFSTVPLKILVGDSEYVDLPTTDAAGMLAHMLAHKGPSSSSCPSPGAFAQEFRRAANSIAVVLSSKLSGTYNSAVSAMKVVLSEDPLRKIHVIDSRATSGTMFLLMRHLRELIYQGLPFEEIVSRAEHYRDQMRVLFTLSSFDNLVKNGRMSRAAGMIATALHIRAVSAATREGEIEVLEKPRGQRKAIERMVSLMGTFKEMKNLPVVITHCNNPLGAQQLGDAVASRYGTTDITIMPTRCLTTYYAGDQALIICF